jgi:nitrous oxide reductase accessory protein NosL
MKNMKNLKFLAVIFLITTLAAVLVACHDNNESADNMAGAKLYPLDTCLVCDMKLAGMGTPYVFVYNQQQIKVCDKSEKAMFDKDPAKYMKKLADAETKQK